MTDINPFYVYKGKENKRTRMSRNLWDGYFIDKKPEKIENDVYLVLRPDKDEKALALFPGKKVVYLRYDNPDDVLMIEKYKNSL